MKRTMIFCYFVFFVIVLAPCVASSYPEPDSPLWLVILGLFSFGIVSISILLYGLSYRPGSFVWIWKITSFPLIIYLVVSWYWESILYPGPEGPLSETVLALATIFGIAVLCPAFYLSFKFGYSNAICDKPNLKFNHKSIAIISFIAILCVVGHFLPDPPSPEYRVKIKVDYIVEYNKLNKPTACEPGQNATAYYEKAFELFVEQPGKLSKSDLNAWPKDLSEEKQILLESWVTANSCALKQLELGTQKPYYWPEYEGNCIWDILPFSSLKKARGIAYAICLRSKLNATKNNFNTGFSDLLSCYRLGNHFTGPKMLIVQLVGIGIRMLALESAFQALDKEKPDSDLLEGLQRELEVLSDKQSGIIDFTGEKFLVYDCIQRAFTDDSKGGGHIYGTRPLENEMYMKQVFGEDLTVDQKSNLEEIGRRQTTELADKAYAYFNREALKTPWQLHSERRAPQKVVEEMVKQNYLLCLLVPAGGKVIERSFRCRVKTIALVTTLALLRYKADKGQLPEELDELVSTEYLKEMPMDPFSDGPLVYKQIGEGFSLYSLGGDCDDDGGIHDSMWQEGDYVFWPVQLSIKQNSDCDIKNDTK